MYEELSIAIVVPTYNEELRIENVLENLSKIFSNFVSEIIVIDDCSTDKTNQVLQTFIENQGMFKIHRNVRNLGHGPSVIKGLKIALNGNANYVLTYDGDGFINRTDVLEAIRWAHLESVDSVLEIVREGRQDPWYRKAVTAILRLVVVIITGKPADDPNSSSRMIGRKHLVRFLEVTSEDNPVPSLWFTIFARRENFDVIQRRVRVEIEPVLEIRNSWNSNFKKLPSKRFLIFCFRASQFWNWNKK